jgi:hypothetical protein
MKYLRRLIRTTLCKHPEKKMVRTDLVLVHRVCKGCGKDFVEPYNGFKALSYHEHH